MEESLSEFVKRVRVNKAPYMLEILENINNKNIKDIVIVKSRSSTVTVFENEDSAKNYCIGNIEPDIKAQ